MRARLTDGYSYAVEFTATARTFKRAAARALFEYAAARGERWRGRPCAYVQIQVHVAGNNWASADFPHSNSPVYVQLGQTLPADLYARCARAQERALYVERALSGFATFVSETPKPILRLVKTD